MPRKNELEEKVKTTTTRAKKKTEVTSNTKKNASTKSTSKTKKTDAKSTTKKTAAVKKTTTKRTTSTKKSTPKKTTKKEVENKNVVTATKPKETVVKRKIEKMEELEIKEKEVKEKVEEATVIEKIKNFLSKIIAMQEENDDVDDEKKPKEKKEASKKEKAIKPDYLLEYYDLPYRYNETTVKILAQTPKKLFVYWDISDNDREKYIKTFGDDFFYKTYPVLLLYNEDKKYIREIPINDFANSWYIDIQDPKNKYTIQLGRKFKDVPQVVNMAEFERENIILRTDYLPFADSNKLEVPNDHVLLESLPRFITFRNVKTNQETIRDLRSFRDVFGKTYRIKEFYKDEYKDELSEEGMFDMKNPSSKGGLSSSSFR